MRVGFINFDGQPVQIRNLQTLAKLCRGYGVEFTASIPDMIIARQECLAPPDGEPWLRAGLPIVVAERTDSASLDMPTRGFIEHENVVAVFKNRTLRHPYLYNYPTASDGRYHGKLVNDFAKVEPSVTLPPLSREALGKIRMVNWDFVSSCCNPNFEGEKAIWPRFDDFRGASQGKDIDVIFLGGSGTYPPALNWHRQKFIDGVGALRGLGLNVLSEGKYDYNDYIALMRRAKVAVSPWGWGEWCWRDYEAILYGCALVKPDTDFLLSSPDIYTDENYYRCSADASDLPEAVSMALMNWPHEIENRFALRRRMIEAMNLEQTAANIAQALHEVYEGWLRRRSR